MSSIARTLLPMLDAKGGAGGFTFPSDDSTTLKQYEAARIKKAQEQIKAMRSKPLNRTATREQVLEVIYMRGQPITRGDIAESLHCVPTALNTHLSKLLAEGKIGRVGANYCYIPPIKPDALAQVVGGGDQQPVKESAANPPIASAAPPIARDCSPVEALSESALIEELQARMNKRIAPLDERDLRVQAARRVAGLLSADIAEQIHSLCDYATGTRMDIIGQNGNEGLHYPVV